MKGTVRLLAAGLLLAGATVVMAGMPPKDSKPLSEILKMVEGQKAGVIFEAEFDHGLWEVEVYKNNTEITFYLDPKSGKESRRSESNDRPSELPPQDGKPLSEIVKAVESETGGVVTDVEFDDGFWEVTVSKDGRKMKMDLDPRSGQATTSTRSANQ
jgi:uncharacterized membrane protein YkoI